MMDSAYEAMERAKRQTVGGNPLGAARTLENYLARDPENHKVRILLASVYIYDLEEFDFGIFQLDAILERDPENTDCLKAKATAMSTYKKFNKETDELFKRVIEMDPSADVYSAYGRFLRMQMLEFRKASEFFLKAIELEPNDVDHRINYAAVLLNDLREYVKAKKELEVIIKLDPENDLAQKNLVKLLKHHFDKDGNLKKGFFHRPKKR